MTRILTSRHKRPLRIPGSSLRASQTPILDDLNYTELDPGIVLAVRTLRNAGVKTVLSCEGGSGHWYRLPAVIFRGDMAEARRVIHIAREARLGPLRIRRVWELADGELPPARPGDDPVGTWEVEFFYKFTTDPTQVAAHIARMNARDEYRKKTGSDIQAQPDRLWPTLLELEPELRRLLTRVQAGIISMNDLWLTFFSCRLDPLIGQNRQDNHWLLSREEAFDAALTRLYQSIPIEPHDPYRS